MDGKHSLKAADIAAGDGRYAIPLAEMGYYVSAIDSSAEACDRMVERIRRRCLNGIRVETTDIFALLPEKRKYDLIVCSGLLEEIPVETHERLILGLRQWTNPQGMNIVRYVVEKRADPTTEGEIVAVHGSIVGLYEGWTKIDTELDANYRQARVGRNMDGMTVNRYFRAAGVVAVRH